MSKVCRVILITVFSLLQVGGVFTYLVLLEVFLWMGFQKKDWMPIIEFFLLTDIIIGNYQTHPVSFLLAILLVLLITTFFLFFGFKFFQNLNEQNKILDHEEYH